MPPVNKSPLLSSVLVTGGCGFLGYALVRQLLADPECGAIHVVDRAIKNNRHDGRATYVEGSITDRTFMTKLLNDTKPTVIFHLASPNPTHPTGPASDMYDTNVKGTQFLLEVASLTNTVKAFVFCSSVDVYDPAIPHTRADESHPLCRPTFGEPYARTKAMADQLVLAASSRKPGLRTVSLRLSHMYGDRCRQQMPTLLSMIDVDGTKWLPQPLIQLGAGKNLCEVVSVDNAAAAHVLAAKALVDPSRANGKVDGEAFNVSDGQAVPFWYHVRQFWGAARGRPVRNEELVVIPEWVTRLVFGLVAWIYWIFTLGRLEPPLAVSDVSLSYSLEEHTYSIDKLRHRLGFRPVQDHDEVIRRAVEEELKRRLAV
ncbi:hypothetical protein B0H66DRAFT_546096 [Apodospora peruviana]|uniref:3-beta hydroxysteroid dehydrogenase/isomerase domain-containing protein n=1 Tax=Apodospora peruviana TaxID=516989 RepID=A0AAE0ITW9_9PEZI|nr:hypothetical protein B0H66DRAFT_546096 [Apodospora peruviana]